MDAQAKVFCFSIVRESHQEYLAAKLHNDFAQPAEIANLGGNAMKSNSNLRGVFFVLRNDGAPGYQNALVR